MLSVYRGMDGRGGVEWKPKEKNTYPNRARFRGRVVGSTMENTKVTGVRLTNEMKPGLMDHQKPRRL